MARKTANSDTQPASYGDAVQQLEQLVTGLESGQMPLEELLTQYQRGTELLRYIYDVMRARVSPTRLQRYLMIEPTGDGPLRFYLRALPIGEYPVKYYEEERVISVGYDGLLL